MRYEKQQRYPNSLGGGVQENHNEGIQRKVFHDYVEINVTDVINKTEGLL